VQQRRGQQRTGEQPPDLLRGAALEDQPGAQPRHAQLGMARLDGVQRALGGGLVTRVERGLDAVRRPRLVHPAVLRARRVGADRGRVDQRARARLRRGLEHPPRARHVDALELGLVARGLDQPGEVDDGVGAGEVRLERIGRDVGAHPARTRVAPLRHPARDAHDLLDALIRGQRAQQCSADVAGGARDDDSHAPGPARRPPYGNDGAGTWTGIPRTKARRPR
jgi:hypothetical protein